MRRGLSSEDESHLTQYWRDLDRRVSARKPVPLGPGVKTGRGPRRKAETDYWEAAGLYDFTNKPQPIVKGRLSRGRVTGDLNTAVAYYEDQIAPLLQSDSDCLDVKLIVDSNRNLVTTLSTWRTGDGFDRIAKDQKYKDAVTDFAQLYFDPASLESDDVDVRST